MFAKKGIRNRAVCSQALSLLLAFILLFGTFNAFAVAECSHTNKQELPMSTGYREIPGDDVYHSYITYYQTRCADCQEILVSQYEKTTKEKHDYGYFSQGIKRCSNCNHEAEVICEHTNEQKFLMNDGYREIPGDDVYHYYIKYYQIRCADCQTILETQTEESTKEKHDYGYPSQGIKRCSNCNHEAEVICEHTNEQKFLMNDGYREIPGDDVYHYYIKYYQIRCADCQTILETQTEESTKEKHDYGYSSQGIKRCSNCNHEAEVVCEHTNEQKFLMNDGYREIPGDDVYHYYIKYYQIRCADCQTILETQTEESTKEKHDYGYSSQGIKRCSNCNHEAEVVCEHANKQQIYLDDTYESIAGDDVYHNHITYYQTRCADCQEILVSQYEDVQKEKHTLDSDGNCSVCHYSASTEQPGKLPDPVVKVKVNGTTAVVTWDAIDGAVRYVYSLRNLTNTTEPAIEHAPVDGLSITLNNLEPESEYRVAIGAVPAGVTDTTVDKDKCSWGRETFTIPAEGKLPDPVVKVTVNGTTAVVTWDAIDGAERYIYSLRNLNTDESIADHAAVSGLSVTLNDLEPGTQYKIAIAAVPAGVSDTHADREKCSWGEKTFTIPAEGKLPDPVVKVTVNGTTAVVTWDAIDGAERYIYSLRNLNTDESIADHAAVSGLSVTLNNLEPGMQYRVSIGAVPAGVSDTHADKDKCSWGMETFEIVRLAKPDVTVVVDGAKMIASWEDVPGAVRYVFSLRKTSEPNGDPPYNHVETDGCSITLDLEPGVEYRLAVAAVPAGVEDTKVETNKCTWALVTFTTETLEEINTPKVLNVETDMKANFLLPGEEVTIKVTCNKATKYLDVYDPAYRTLKDPEFNKEGYPYFEYIVSYAATGKMELRFIALDEQLEWSRKKEHQGFLDIIVCDHTTTPKLISTSNATKKDRNVHTVTETYEDACLCGKVSNTWSKEVDKPHTWGALQASKTHTQGKGHRRFYECTACHQVKDADYVSFVKGYIDTCSTCRARFELIRELQELLNKRGYNAGKEDGIFGNKTKNAMNAFRKDVMKLGPIDDVDEATMAALRNGSVEKTPLAGKILEPGNGDSVEFFKDGVIKISWVPLEGSWNYTLTLKEGNEVIYNETIPGNNVSKMTKYIYADSYGMKKYTENEKKQDHIITISITAVPAQ